MITNEESEELVKLAVAPKTTDVVVEPPFNVEESISRIQRFEQRGTEFKIKSGLELLLAKLSIDHGDWYKFVFKAELSPSTATRRMQTAVQFMAWFHSCPLYKPRRGDVIGAIWLADHEPCKLHAFRAAQPMDVDRFWNEMPKQANNFLLPSDGPRGHYPSVNLKQWKKIEQYIRNGYKKLKAHEKQQFRELLQMQADRSIALVRLLEEVDPELLAGKEPESDRTTSWTTLYSLSQSFQQPVPLMPVN
jgi:hypothetical protein